MLLTRKRRSKWWELICFGPKSHYRKTDGGCVHTDEVLARLNPELVPIERVRVEGFGGEA